MRNLARPSSLKPRRTGPPNRKVPAPRGPKTNEFIAPPSHLGVTGEPDRDDDRGLVFFTIVAWNYLSYAVTLMRSLESTHPRATRYIVLCDIRNSAPALPPHMPADLLFLDQLGIPDFESMALAYDVMELSTAIKPFTFLLFFKTIPGARVVYLDPDILVFDRLDEVISAFSDGREMILTPHIMKPLQDGRQPDDLTIMKSGIYNLGFAAIRNAPEAKDFVLWWADRCLRDAVVDLPNHKFTDQRWVDLAPAFVEHLKILRHNGYNVAYWNLAHRRISRLVGHGGMKYLVEGEPLRFVHFSGVVPNNQMVLSKHQDKFSLDDLPEFKELLRAYVAQIYQNGWEVSSRVSYGYGRLANGRRIHKTMRLSFIRHESAECLRGAQLLSSSGELFDSPEPSIASLGPPSIPRTLFELWHQRPDLQKAFPLGQAQARRDFLNWFCETGAAEAGLDSASVEAARNCLEQGADHRFLSLRPWPPQVEECLQRSKAAVDVWLAAPVAINLETFGAGTLVPRLLALLWESRADLRHHFPNRNQGEIDEYLAWAITGGLKEKSLPADLAARALSAYLNGSEGRAEQSSPDAAPTTRLMRLIRPLWFAAPEHPPGTLPKTLRPDWAYIIWLCGQGRHEFSWPLDLLLRLVQWLRAPYKMPGGMPVPTLVYVVYCLRTDVQDAFDIRTVRGAWQVMAWFVCYGLYETRLCPDLCPTEFKLWLLSPFPGRRGARLRVIDHLVWLGRPEVGARFARRTAEDELFLSEWIDFRAREILELKPWIDELSIGMGPVPADRQIPARICLTGMWTSSSGRGEDVRMTAKSLRQQNVDFTIFDLRAGKFLNEDGTEASVDPASILLNIVHTNADTSLADYLVMRKHGLAGCYTIGYWAWELAAFPKEWTSAFSFVDEVWASTRFATQAFDAPKRRTVYWMPMAVEVNTDAVVFDRSRFKLPADRFIFYYGFDFASYAARKNPEAAVKAFRRAFHGYGGGVFLVIKTLNGDRDPGAMAKLRGFCGDDPRILIYNNEYERNELLGLIGSCDCFVSPHRSEGFGRGPAEAMRLGLSVITTGYSGNVDFTTDKTAFLIDYALVPVGKGEYPGAEGQVWAEADVAHCATLMRLVVEDRPRAARIAKRGKEFMEVNYDAKHVGERYKVRIDEIISRETARPLSRSRTAVAAEMDAT